MRLEVPELAALELWKSLETDAKAEVEKEAVAVVVEEAEKKEEEEEESSRDGGELCHVCLAAVALMSRDVENIDMNNMNRFVVQFP